MTIENIPEELRGIKQWSISYNTSELKRPLDHRYIPNGGYNAEEAFNLAIGRLLTGFYVTKEDPYVLIDIDHVDPKSPWFTVPKSLRPFINVVPTYWEVSPSGKGLRGIVKLPDNSYKININKRALLLNGDGSTSDEAEIHLGPPWMTITGNKTEYSSDTIATVPIETLKKLFNITSNNGSPRGEPTKPKGKMENLSDITKTLMRLPLNKNPRVKRAYKKIFEQEYHHYDYWMKVMMALHNYSEITGTNLECLELFDSWSSNDEESYNGFTDVKNHWLSLSSKDKAGITYKTLYGLYYEITLTWPIRRKSKAGDLPKPNISAYLNFLEMLKHYSIEFHADEIKASSKYSIYLTGDEDVLDKYFTGPGISKHFDKYYGLFNRDVLIACMYTFMSDLDFTGITTARVREFIDSYIGGGGTKRVNFIRLYIETPLEELPYKYQEGVENFDRSTINDLFNCLTIEPITDTVEQEMMLYRKYYLAWMLGIVRNLYYPDKNLSINNCILVLSGPEQIRKTSHFKYMFPSFLREYIVFTACEFKSEGSLRDIAKISSENLVVVWDEIETQLTYETESNFKKVIDNTRQTFIDKYEVDVTTAEPIAIYGGTSNQVEFKLGDSGSRRMFIIPVSWVDTESMDKICWHRILNQLKDIYDKAMQERRTPWLLTEEEIDFQIKCHNKIKAKSSLDVVLSEIFDTSELLKYSGNGKYIKGISSIQTDTSGRLLTTKEIATYISRYDNEISFNRVALEKALQRFCGAYTGTDRKAKTLFGPACTITRGRAVQGIHKRWVVPPLTKEAEDLVNPFKKL